MSQDDRPAPTFESAAVAQTPSLIVWHFQLAI